MDLKTPLPIPHPSRRNRAARHRVCQQELTFAEVLLLRSHIVLPSWVLIICRVRSICKDWLSFASAGGLSFYYSDLTFRQAVEFIYQLINLMICCINLTLDHCFR